MPADVGKFIEGLKKAQAAKIAAAVRGVEKFANHVIGDAQQLTPVDTGALQASGTAGEATLEGTKIECPIGFNTDYAAAVHENLTAHHEIGQAKYLETAMKNNADKFGPFMAAEIAKAEH